MATNYPASLDTTAQLPNDQTDATATDRAGVDHAAEHVNISDALRAVETELGVNPSGSFTDVASRLNQVTTVRKTADQNFTTTTLANVTDMVFPVVVGGYYKFEFFIVWSAAAAGATQQYAVTFPASTYGLYFSESFNVTAIGSDSAANATDGVTTGLTVTSGTKVGGVGVTGVPAANTKTITRITGILANVTTAGNLQLQAATETASTSTCFAGSHGILWTN